MRTRPTSITVIGWFLIVSGLLILPGMWRRSDDPGAQSVMERNSLPIPLQRAIRIIGSVVELVCGYYLLRGRNWARYTYLVWATFQLTYGFVVSPYKLFVVIGVVFELLVLYFLFRPTANAFFTGSGAKGEIQNRMSRRQIASVCCYIAGGFFLASNSLIAFSMPDDVSITMMLLGFVSVAPLVLLAIGKAFSPNLNWPKEIGIVLLASALGGAMFSLVLVVLFANPEFQKLLSPGKPVPVHNYTSGALWTGLLAGLGGLAIYSGRKKS